MKKSWLAFLSLVLVAAFTGCGGSSEPAAPAGGGGNPRAGADDAGETAVEAPAEAPVEAPAE